MRKWIILLAIPFYAFGHGGDDHGANESKPTTLTYFSSEAVSDKYELLLKYDPIKPGKETTLRLFVSEYFSNKPLDSCDISITAQENKDIKFRITNSDEGLYEIDVTFPDEKQYSLAVNVKGPLGADLLLLQGIVPGKELVFEEAHEHSIFENAFVLVGIGIITGIGLMFLVMRTRYRKAASVLLTVIIALPAGSLNHATAHDGHGDASESGNNFSTSFLVPKETQFLFGVLTEPLRANAFTESTQLFGTVIPSSSGQAIVQSSQSGRISALHTYVGQKVAKGDLLAVLEPSVDAGNMMTLLAEKNNIEAELNAAKKEYDRLKSIEDIAAKRDVAEAEARYQKARENNQLFNNLNAQGNAHAMLLRAPISGIVGNFTYATGSAVSANQAIFTITDLSKVYVEAQVFDKDAEKVSTGKNFLVECTNADDHKTAQVRLLAAAQSINPTNQTQRVIFEMENTDGDFKIGEFVNVRVMGEQQSRKLTVPNSAITEINGKPAIFIKDKSEHYSLSYVTLGENNGTRTIIDKGAEEDERIVINGTYQMKMIYLNQ